MKQTAHEPQAAACGARVLRRILREETSDLRALDLAGFREWLAGHLARWQRDPVFQARSRIRDFRRGCPDLRSVERDLRRAARADAASDAYPRLWQLEQAIRGAEQAVAGLTEAVKRAPAGEVARLRTKRDAFRAELRDFKAERRSLARSSDERRALRRVEAKLRRLRASLGLDEQEADLARLLRERGRRGGGAGRSFETTAEVAVRRFVLPEVVGKTGGASSGGVRILRGVTLGAAKVELDRVVVRERGENTVDVLAVIEAKRNINDLAHGLRRRQEDLAWLTGDPTGAADLRTKTFPAGRFDREVVHEQDGEAFRFGPASFRRFRRDAATRLFLDRLYLVSRQGMVWGVSSAALAKIGHRVATDERWTSDDETYLGELFAWCRSLAGDFESPDLLRLYAGDATRAKRLIMVDGWRRPDATAASVYIPVARV